MLYLKKGYDALVAREALWTRRLQRGEKQRARMFVFGACTLAVAIVALLVSAYVFFGRGPTRSYYNGQFADIGCLAVWGVPDDVLDAGTVRAHYHCPPFQPSHTR